MSDRYVPVFNIKDNPVILDDSGRTLGGREWGWAKPTQKEVAAAVSAGYLVVTDLDPKTESLAPDAIAAANEAATRNEKADQLNKFSKADLIKAAEDRMFRPEFERVAPGLLDGEHPGGTPHVADLIDGFTRSELSVAHIEEFLADQDAESGEDAAGSPETPAETKTTNGRKATTQKKD